VRAPRTQQELGSQLAVAVEELARVRECLPAVVVWSSQWRSTEDVRLIDILSGPGHGLDAVDRRETLRWRWPGRRSGSDASSDCGSLAMTQAQTAERTGVSQTQLSRLLTRSLIRLPTPWGPTDAVEREAGPHSRAPADR
jgi:hypothetical protein